jgi:hypothetical protein
VIDEESITVPGISRGNAVWALIEREPVVVVDNDAVRDSPVVRRLEPAELPPKRLGRCGRLRRGCVAEEYSDVVNPVY